MLAKNTKMPLDRFRHGKEILILGMCFQICCFSSVLKARSSMINQPVYAINWLIAEQILVNCRHQEICQNVLAIPDRVSKSIVQWGSNGSRMTGVGSSGTGAKVASEDHIPSPSESTNVHSTKHRQEEDPPQPPLPTAQVQKESVEQSTEFDLLLERFGNQLRLVKDQGMFVVLETDLDDTWVQSPRKQQLLESDTTRAQEQQKMQKLNRFFADFSDVLFLVYNTARSPKGCMMAPKKKFREVGINETGFFPDGVGEGMLFKSLYGGRPKWILPIPDVLIMELGAHIEVRETIGGSGNISVAEAHELNKTIKGWSESDFQDLDALNRALKPLFSILGGYTLFKNCLVIADPIFFAKWSGVKEKVFEAQQSPSFSASFAPEMQVSGGNTVVKGLGSLVSVNKGSTFRLILNKVIEKRQAEQQGSTPIVFVFGDSLLDMTMLVPTLEIKGFGPVNEDAITNRDTRFRQAGVQTGNLIDINWWEKSIIPFGAMLSNSKCCGEYIKQALSDPRVVVSDKWGVASLIKSMVEQLEKRFGAPQNEMTAY